MMIKTMKSAVFAAALGMGFSLNANAVLIDLKLDNGGTQTCAAINGGWVCNRTGDAGSVGSGTFPSFVATPGGQDPQFSFYNTEGAIETDNAVGNGMGDNETLQLSQLGVTEFMSTNVVTFALDINQINSGEPQRFLTLNHIALFGSGDGALSGYSAGSPDSLGGTDAFWQLGDYEIDLNYDLAFGSGNDIDMYLLLDVSVFDGLDLSTYLQLYSLFGDPNINNDGFEEWAYQRCDSDDGCIPRDPPTCEELGNCPVPEPAPLGMLGLGLLGLYAVRRKYAVK